MRQMNEMSNEDAAQFGGMDPRIRYGQDNSGNFFRGQGNQNVGSGTISIGGGQSFNQNGR